MIARLREWLVSLITEAVLSAYDQIEAERVNNRNAYTKRQADRERQDVHDALHQIDTKGIQ